MKAFVALVWQCSYYTTTLYQQLVFLHVWNCSISNLIFFFNEKIDIIKNAFKKYISTTIIKITTHVLDKRLIILVNLIY